MEDLKRDPVYDELLNQLTAQYGPLMAGSDLRQVLGFRTAGAMRQAIRRHQIDVPLLKLSYRQQKAALTIDVARWLWRAREKGQIESEEGTHVK